MWLINDKSNMWKQIWLHPRVWFLFINGSQMWGQIGINWRACKSTDCWAPALEFLFSRSVCSPRMRSSYMSPDDADAAGLGTTLRKLLCTVVSLIRKTYMGYFTFYYWQDLLFKIKYLRIIWKMKYYILMN